MFGVVNKLYLCNQERSRELNDRISLRNIPSAPLQPQYSMRPVLTKYSIMPILDQRATPSVPMESFPTFNPEQTFNPGNAQAPWSGYASNIDDDSKLRNQFFAIQKCDQAYYIPPTTSDMYKVEVDGQPIQQPFPDLFTKQQFLPFNPNLCGGNDKFFDNCIFISCGNNNFSYSKFIIMINYISDYRFFMNWNHGFWNGFCIFRQSSSSTTC